MLDTYICCEMSHGKASSHYFII